MRNDHPISRELLLKEDVRRLLDDFAALLKLRAVFFSSDGREIERGRDAECSGYCRLMQKERFGLAACMELDRARQKECREKKRLISYVCHAGLGEIVAPVMIFGNVAGFLVIGQFRVVAECPAFLRFPEEKERYLELPLFCGDDLRNLEHMLQMLLECIVAKELVAYPQDLKMFKLDRFIETHLAEKITLAAAARACACSQSSLTHYLCREQKICFSALVMKKRVSAAEKLLKEHPDWTLDVIAEKTGFNSAYYLSRVFRRLRGTTPGRFRKT
ncbi:MAG: PocR ligand-binding domain-containing protein [Victivallaceae bacterium]|nr:PocR ligand-binding domain-containing protein [Victivallaceae bacterium]